MPRRVIAPMSRKLGVFILSHGRPNNVKTYASLRRCGYTGPIYILVDDEDSSREQYIENYGDEVIVFNKKEAASITDAGDNFGKRNSVVFARNQNFEVAREIGLTHFWQLDDDYSDFGWTTNNRDKYITGPERVTSSLDAILDLMFDFLDESNAHCLAFAQGGDMFGGADGTVVRKIREGRFMRKVMNSFLCRTDRPFKFYGRMNDDVNMFVVNGNRGHLFITVPRLRLWQAETQKSDGGLTEMYLESGTYIKSFYSVLYAPSCIKISPMGRKHQRLHHQVKWKNAVPCILKEDYKKGYK